MESVKCHIIELNQLGVHLILSFEKNIVFVVVLSLFLTDYHALVSVKLDI